LNKAFIQTPERPSYHNPAQKILIRPQQIWNLLIGFTNSFSITIMGLSFDYQKQRTSFSRN